MSAGAHLRIPATYVNALIRQYRDVLDDDAISLDLAKLETNSGIAQTDIQSLFALIEALNKQVGPEWPIEASFAWRSQMHGTIDVAARSARTLGDALNVFARFGRVRAPFAVINKNVWSKTTALKIQPSVSMEDSVWQALAEFIMLSTTAILNQITDDRLSGVTFEMPNRTFQHKQSLEDAFGVPTQFGGTQFTMTFTNETCSLVLPFHDPLLFKNTVEQLQSETEQLSHHNWIVEDVRRLLSSQNHIRPSAQFVADELGLSRRSLVRKLTANQTSFRTMLDDHLKERATKMLGQDKMSKEAISEALGYTDRTSFSRACRRWFDI
ncbi:MULTISPECIES: AraC family transcriptional regulator [Sphingomonadaceae]|nr:MULTISPECIES: AraC family transcriptional regulator [unclassified Sphingorhabdus]ASK87193.1 HTH-type transcriptional regulator VirS [Sphingorhabdus sp. SMR4y]VWX62338.1 HTH-type transcriptional regulator VirS [Sphingorhabdus sp. 109]